MNKIAIIGCGFSGTMTAFHLINDATKPFEMIMIDTHDHFNKGIAYNPYSKKQLLNVIASRMSAFHDKPHHFVNWVSKQPAYSGIDRCLLENTYLPRYLYGEYLSEIWNEATKSAAAKSIVITRKDARVADIDIIDRGFALFLDNGERLSAHYLVVATGNQSPGNPANVTGEFAGHPRYHQDPWDARVVKHHTPDAPVLILGSGLTMADTVLGLIENGFRNKIHTISPHGFTMLPHLHTAIIYTAITEELQGPESLSDVVRIVNKHVKIARSHGFTAEPVVDAIRPLTQDIWQNLTLQEKRIFRTRLRHLWDAVRHRIPPHIHEQLRQLNLNGRLNHITGNARSISPEKNCMRVVYFDRHAGIEKEISVSCVINCTGPEVNMLKSEGSLLRRCLDKGFIIQDDLQSGILADPVTFEVYNRQFRRQANFHIVGPLLKGVLWESIAVRELRQQAERLAKLIIEKITLSSGC